MRGLYWGILAWGHGSTAWTSAVSKYGTWTKLVYLEFIGFCKQNQGLSGNQSKGFDLTQDYLAI